MKKEITVKQAIKKGEMLMIYPSMLIFLISILLPLAVFKIFNTDWVLPVCIFVSSLFSSILYWAYIVTKWRLWAFENVRNVHELKERAIKAHLINSDNSFFTKMEIRSKEEKRKWRSLLDKFNEDDVFIDDPNVPPETKIYFSKPTNYFQMFIGIFLIAGGSFIVFSRFNDINVNFFVGIAMTITGIYMAYKNYKEATNNEPQIIISDQGIETASTQFYKWEHIKNEDSKVVGSGKSSQRIFTYDHPEGNEYLNIDDIATNIGELYDLLKLYRGRYNKRQKEE